MGGSGGKLFSWLQNINRAGSRILVRVYLVKPAEEVRDATEK